MPNPQIDPPEGVRAWSFGDGNPVMKGIPPEEVAARDRAILEMTAEGKRPDTIARLTGLHKKTVYDIIRKRVNALVAPSAEVVRTQEYERLEYLRTQVIQPVIEGKHPVLHQGVIVDGVSDVGPVLRAVEIDARLGAEMRKLTGADVPVKAEVTGAVSFTLVGVDPDDVR